MTKEEITERALRLRREHGIIHNYHVLLRALDISENFLHMGGGPDCIKGFISRNSRCSCCTLNIDLPSHLQRLIVYHEVGHYVLGHIESGVNLFTLMNNDRRWSNIKELEANLFVAEYLMDNDETLETLRETNNFYAAAQIMRVPPEFMEFKWRMLRYYNLVSGETPFHAQSDFLKQIH